jgi:hypothetical protein
MKRSDGWSITYPNGDSKFFEDYAEFMSAYTELWIKRQSIEFDRSQTEERITWQDAMHKIAGHGL